MERRTYGTQLPIQRGYVAVCGHVPDLTREEVHIEQVLHLQEGVMWLPVTISRTSLWERMSRNTNTPPK